MTSALLPYNSKRAESHAVYSSFHYLMEPLQKEVNLAESVVISAMLYVCKVDFHVPISA